MKIIDPFDLKQLARVGIAKYDPKKMEWKFNGIKFLICIESIKFDLVKNFWYNIYRKEKGTKYFF